jgi:hypothetical protein
MFYMKQMGAGVLDSGAVIEMNNLAVGYFPTHTPEIGIYPPLVVTQPFQQEPGPELEPNSETNSAAFPCGAPL